MKTKVGKRGKDIGTPVLKLSCMDLYLLSFEKPNPNPSLNPNPNPNPSPSPNPNPNANPRQNPNPNPSQNPNPSPKPNPSSSPSPSTTEDACRWQGPVSCKVAKDNGADSSMVSAGTFVGKKKTGVSF